VLAFVQARADEGGAGAVVVLLRAARPGATMP
jgi:DNA-nicking Smr family endonuclease